MFVLWGLENVYFDLNGGKEGGGGATTLIYSK